MDTLVTMLPTQTPKRIVFDQREDGFYNITIESLAIDSQNKIIPAVAKFVAPMPSWFNWSFDMVKQEDNSLFTISYPEDE